VDKIEAYHIGERLFCTASQFDLAGFSSENHQKFTACDKRKWSSVSKSNDRYSLLK